MEKKTEVPQREKCKALMKVFALGNGYGDEFPFPLIEQQKMSVNGQKIVWLGYSSEMEGPVVSSVKIQRFLFCGLETWAECFIEVHID